ncbi:MobF family relaxase [Leptolyngbya sp. NIES-2104]|uniref:MobF family relaxase n=1 Tax=Leptolyngbya sp. NIES-2104 TaxID=1552121 RepID=UPI0006EC510B|nr:MobF family relaxase [Leptolyngbya sp. NIES-2104]GAP99081.1 IncW plasmid conjugative relaxase protein TrwC [Leptolyngbya sp. NIES-2104]
MLSSKNLSATEAAGYHGKDDDRRFNSNDPSELQSCWFGKGAATLNLKGEVVPEVFNQLVLGVDLAGNSLHAKPINLEKHRAGTDFCFSAPKSVSIAALLQQDRRVISAHNHAVTVALTAMEDRYPQARVWNRQQQRQERILTRNITAALFPHSTSRNCDPQLHTHAFVLNTTQLEDGSWRALSNEEMTTYKKFVGQIYQNQIAYELRQMGYEIEPRKNGQFELRGYSKPLCDLFSSRRQQIESYAEQSERSKDAKLYEQATLHTRQHKREIPLDALIEGWERAIAEQKLELPPTPESDQAQSVSEIGREKAATAAVVGLEIAEHQEFEFCREAIEQPALEDSVGQQSWEQLQNAIDEMNRLVAINLSLNLYTTETAVKRKREILQTVQQGQGSGNAIASSENVAELDTEFLTQERRQGLGMAATSTDQFIAWQGVEKDEPTYALTLYRQIAESQGYTVQEFSPRSDFNQTEERSNEIWLIREAESLTAHNFYRLMQSAEVSQARVLFIGDEREPQGNLFQTLPAFGITTTNLRTGKQFTPDQHPTPVITLTHLQDNTYARNQTWEKATAVERYPRTAASDRATRRSHTEECVEQSVGERIGTAIGERIAESFAASQSEGRFPIEATRFAGIDVERTAQGIAETIARRAIERCSEDLSQNFEKIDGCLQQHRNDLDRFEDLLREFEGHIRRIETIHHRAVNHLSKREITKLPEQTKIESTPLETLSRSQQSSPEQDGLSNSILENTVIELEPSGQEWLPERNDHGWETVRQNLVTEYKIPDWLLQELNQQGWIYSNQKKQAVFVERTLDDKNYHGLTLSKEGYLDPTEPNAKYHAASSFWMATREPLERAIILDDPLEVLAVHGINTTGSKNIPTLYIAAMRVDQLPIDLLKDIPQVRVSTSCTDEVKQAMKENVPHRTMIAPNHVESWRGVWRDWSIQKQIQSKKSKAATPPDIQL